MANLSWAQVVCTDADGYHTDDCWYVVLTETMQTQIVCMFRETTTKQVRVSHARYNILLLKQTDGTRIFVALAGPESGR